ncbi:MAG: hypothetical protein H0W04_07220 [Chthoniobacterales bacterium]|nr:hypothetical protein [Chthoniobacterales bacterium]
MKKLTLFIPAIAALPLLALTSCTAVVEPTPATTSTTVHSQQAVTRPDAVSTTTTRTGGY